MRPSDPDVRIETVRRSLALIRLLSPDSDQLDRRVYRFLTSVHIDPANWRDWFHDQPGRATPKLLFHYTPVENVDRILSDGIIPGADAQYSLARKHYGPGHFSANGRHYKVWLSEIKYNKPTTSEEFCDIFRYHNGKISRISVDTAHIGNISKVRRTIYTSSDKISADAIIDAVPIGI